MALEGSLHDLSLIDLLQLLRMGSKTGVLWLIGGAEHGMVYVRAGSLIDAVLMRGPDRQVIATADDAVICLLQWTDASWTFQSDPKVSWLPVRVLHDHEWLMLESRRWRERSPQPAPGQVITLDTCFVLSGPLGGGAGTFKLDLEQLRILSQLPVRPSAREICSSTGLTPEQTLARLTQLLVLGLIEVV